MSEELQSQETGAKAGLPMPVHQTLAAGEQRPWDALEPGKDRGGATSASDGIYPGRTLTEASLPSPTRPQPENENVGTSTLLDDNDPIELELVAKLDALLAQDVELSAAYQVLLQNRRKTGRERRRMRAELRLLHTKEGAFLFEVKLHRAKKGRDGKWAQFLRERKPKKLSRTTADRWIKWYLDSLKQQQSLQPVSENAPQNESGAFSGDAESQPAAGAGDQQLTATTDPPPMDHSKAFEDPQQVILVLKKSQAAQFKAAAGFLADKMGSATHHQAIYVTVVEAAEKLGFVYPDDSNKGENIDDVSKTVNPGNETSPAGSEAA